MKTLLITSNTGGHIYPAIALAQSLKNKEPHSEIMFVVGEKTLGTQIIPEYGFQLKTIPTKRLPRYLSWQILLIPWILFIQFIQSLKILYNFKPNIVISTGGFMALPLIMLAKIFKIPSLLLEQNLIPGISNKTALFFAEKMVTSFEETLKYVPHKTILLGTPIRQSILKETRSAAIEQLNLALDKKTVLILGGSQGAKSINTIMPEVAVILNKNLSLQFIHDAGERNYPQLLQTIKDSKLLDYHAFAYLEDMGKALATADLVVSRAGGSTLAEILCAGIPAILIPYPYAADNHQECNARDIEKKGGAIVIPESKLSAYNLASIIQQLLDNPNKLVQMRNAQLSMARPGAAKDIVDLALSMRSERALIR